MASLKIVEPSHYAVDRLFGLDKNSSFSHFTDLFSPNDILRDGYCVRLCIVTVAFDPKNSPPLLKVVLRGTSAPDEALLRKR